jgi:outer membrane biosynthesis protein TonB
MEMNNNEQHTFDIAVRQALENLAPPFNADHWELMDGKLDALNAEEIAFDNIISSKLADVTTPFVAANWALMDSQLDVLEAQDVDFDTQLAQKLTNIEVPYMAANWFDMNDRLDELDNADNAFDNLLRQSLSNVQPQMPANHWALMENKIEEAFSWRRKIVRYKVVEVALVLLTLFTVVNNFDLPFDSVRSTDVSKPVEAVEKDQKGDVKQATPTPTPAQKSFYNPTDWRNRPATPNNNNTQPVQKGNNKPIVATDNMNNVSPPNPITVQLTQNSETPTTHVSQNTVAVQGTNNSQNESFDNTVNNNVQAIEPTTIAITNTGAGNAQNTYGTSRENREGYETASLPPRKALELGKITDGIVIDEDVASIAGTEMSEIDILKPSFLATRIIDDNAVFPVFKEHRAKWRLNIFGAPSVDMVSVNYLLYRKPEENTQRVPNLAAGLAVSYKTGHFEVETGLSYLDKKYDLPNLEVTTGSFLRSDGYTKQKPQNLRLSIVSIPLSINYSSKATRRLSLYARLGTALNTILKSEVSQFVDGKGKTDANTFELNSYPKGITEKGFFKDGKWWNGGLKENTYLTASVGVGLEYRLTNNTDIYLQPTVDYHYKRGIGTLNDRVHSLSIQGGVKTKLK